MTNWKKKFIEETLDKFGEMPAPWIYQPGCHPYSIGWRMGAGESYMMYIWDWIEEQNWTLSEKAEFFQEAKASSSMVALGTLCTLRRR